MTDDELMYPEAGGELWLSAGEEVITERQPAEYFYVLLNGLVPVTKNVC